MPEGKRNETLETHIGIVGTEARINQEELVKSRRKIWFAPMAAVALVLMLVAVVFAAQSPAPGTPIPDQTIIIGATAATSGVLDDNNIVNLTIDLTDIDGDDVRDDAAFTDPDHSDTSLVTLAYTAMSSDVGLRMSLWAPAQTALWCN